MLARGGGGSVRIRLGGGGEDEESVLGLVVVAVVVVIRGEVDAALEGGEESRGVAGRLALHGCWR